MAGRSGYPPANLVNMRSPRQQGNPSMPVPAHQPQAQPTPNPKPKSFSLEQILNSCPGSPRPRPMHTVTDASHSFLIKPFQFDPARLVAPEPILKERGYVDQYDADHVLMPCSPTFRYMDGRLVWPTIQASLKKLIDLCDGQKATFADLKETLDFVAGRILDVDCLEHVITKMLKPKEQAEFFKTTLRCICKLAMKVDAICSKSPRLLKAGRQDSLTMSQLQAASLLSCAFFCLFPIRADLSSAQGNRAFQDPNFATLYRRGPPSKLGKILCILNYFRRIAEHVPCGVITFKRYGLSESEFPNWSTSTAPLVPIHITSSEKIEEIDRTLQVDFANRFIGGGVLGGGCVQEEIRFVICPEMLVSLLLCEVMMPNEAIQLIGCEQYSKYVGYAESFEFGGNHVDANLRDDWGRRLSRVVAMDAMYFANPADQYQPKNLDRELLKAYVGFYTTQQSAERLWAVTTGHWGCGAFNGDRQFKAIIQLIAASQARRPMIFAAYLDKKFVLEFEQIYDFFLRNKLQVRDLYGYLQAYCQSRTRLPVFQFILQPAKL